MALVISTVFPYGILAKGTAIGPTDFITSGALFLLCVLVLYKLGLRITWAA